MDQPPGAPDAPIPEATRAALRAADEKRRRNVAPVSGVAVAPSAMAVTWWMTGNPGAADSVGLWIFCAALVVLLITVPAFDRHSRRLSGVRQDVAVTVQGVRGPVREVYGARYDYDRFTADHLHAYRRMHGWGRAAIAAFFVAAGYAVMLVFGPYFWG